MAEDKNVVQQLFARIRTFGWHEEKRARNLHLHKIDFRDVRSIFDGYTFIRRSDSDDEVRYQVFGYVKGREIAVVCTLRGEQCWIISARRAHRGEREKYYGGLAGRSPTGED
jgi:uncharacterized DUF497 family protein